MVTLGDFASVDMWERMQTMPASELRKVGSGPKGNGKGARRARGSRRARQGLGAEGAESDEGLNEDTVPLSRSTGLATPSACTLTSGACTHFLSADRQTTTAELDAVLDYFAKIKDRCIAKPETYESRKARREAEIQGLKEALSVLRDETALVQRNKKRSRANFLEVGQQ